MTNESIPTGPSAHVTFTRSSSKDGGTGYTVSATSDATPEDVDRAFEAARTLRRLAQEELAGDLARDLERSLNASGSGHF